MQGTVPQVRFVGQPQTPVHRHPHGSRGGPGHLRGMRLYPVQLCADATWLDQQPNLEFHVRYAQVLRGTRLPAELGPDAFAQSFTLPVTLFAGLVPGEVRRDNDIRLAHEVDDLVMQAFERTGRAVVARGPGARANEVSVSLLLTASRCQTDPSGVMDLLLVAEGPTVTELARAPRVEMPSKAPKRAADSNLQQRHRCDMRRQLVQLIFGAAQPPLAALAAAAAQTRRAAGDDEGDSDDERGDDSDTAHGTGGCARGTENDGSSWARVPATHATSEQPMLMDWGGAEMEFLAAGARKSGVVVFTDAHSV